MTTTPIDPLLGRTVAGRLELRELLGTGSMGRVYRAHHHGLDKEVAIKVLRRHPGATEMSALRFKLEARAASRLDHPNSVRVFDFGEDDGLLYLAMEYLPGRDLQGVLRGEGRLGPYRAAWLMAQVASALTAAHAAGVIHRDLKPGNIMLVDRPAEDGVVHDFVKVCDFGLAKILDPGAEPRTGSLTRQGVVFGTPAYMSPEQALGMPLDARSDLYAVGAILYRVLVGRPPFEGDSPSKVLLKHIENAVPSVAAAVPGVDPRLAAIVSRCMAKTPEDRFDSARSLLDALREILQEAELDVPGMGHPVRAPSTHRARLESLGPAAQLSVPPAESVPGDDTLSETRLESEAETARLMATHWPGDATQEASAEIGRLPSAPWWTWIPGAVALMMTGALAVYVLLGPH